MCEEKEICDPENCCADCKHGSIPCEGLTFEAWEGDEND